MRILCITIKLFLLLLCLPVISSAQLIWPDDELGMIWATKGFSSKQNLYQSTWPRDYKEVCQDASWLTGRVIKARFEKLCKQKKQAPVINVTANVASQTLNKRYPLGDSLDNRGISSGTSLVYKVPAEQGQSYGNLPPFVQTELQHRFSKNIYVYFRMNVATALDAWHDDPVGFNVPLALKDLDINEPSLGYFSLDFLHLSVILGRFPVHWSPSPKYGMSLTSSVPYHDGIMTSLKSKYLRYHFHISSFNPWLSGTPDSFNGDYPAGSEHYRQRNPEYSPGSNTHYNSRNLIYAEPVKTLFSHRLETSFKFLELGLTEQVVIGGKHPSLRDGNPLVVFHNNFGDGYSNSGLGLDARINLFNSLSLFGELYLDEINEFEDAGSPTLAGWLTGIQHSFEINRYEFFHSFHVIRTASYLYNHTLPYLTQYSRHVLKSNFIDRGSMPPPYIDTYVIDYPLGYFRGSDAFDLWYNIRGFFSEKLAGSLEAGYLRQGEKDIYSLFERSKISSPSGIEETEWRVSLSAEYKFTDRFMAKSGYGFQYLDNAHHISGNEAVHQQVFAGVSASWH